MFISWQASPETSVSLNGSQNLVYETEHLRTQLNDSLKEIHQKELRIQQLNSKVCVPWEPEVQFLVSMTRSKKVSRSCLSLGSSSVRRQKFYLSQSLDPSL